MLSLQSGSMRLSRRFTQRGNIHPVYRSLHPTDLNRTRRGQYVRVMSWDCLKCTIAPEVTVLVCTRRVSSLPRRHLHPLRVVSGVKYYTAAQRPDLPSRPSRSSHLVAQGCVPLAHHVHCREPRTWIASLRRCEVDSTRLRPSSWESGTGKPTGLLRLKTECSAARVYQISDLQTPSSSLSSAAEAQNAEEGGYAKVRA